MASGDAGFGLTAGFRPQVIERPIMKRRSRALVDKDSAGIAGDPIVGRKAKAWVVPARFFP